MNGSLLKEIDAFIAETGMTEYRFGMLAITNGRLVERLRAGVTEKTGKPVRIWPDTEERVRAFIAAERQKRGVAA
jgi:hypothetical protein